MPSWPDRINTLLDRLDLTQGDFAELIGVSQGSVSQWTLGIETPRRACIVRLLDMLETHPEEGLRLLETVRSEFVDPHLRPLSFGENVRAFRKKRGLSRAVTADILGVIEHTLMTAENDPSYVPVTLCPYLMLDIFQNHPETADLLLGPFIPRFRLPEEWSYERFMDLLLDLGLNANKFSKLINVSRQAVFQWKTTLVPGRCAMLFIELLQAYGKNMVELLSETPTDTQWSGPRVRAVREGLSLSPRELPALTGFLYDTVLGYERFGLPSEAGCVQLFYTLLERYPQRMLEALEGLE